MRQVQMWYPRCLNVNATKRDVRYIFCSISGENLPYFGTRFICIPLKKILALAGLGLGCLYLQFLLLHIMQTLCCCHQKDYWIKEIRNMIEEHDSSQEHHSKELKEQLEQLKHERDDVSSGSSSSSSCS